MYILLNHWFYIMRFLFLLWYYLVKHFDNIIQFLLKTSLIWWDKFIYNFKYIFINKTGFIKKNCNNCGQINKKWSFTGWGETSQGPKGWERGKKKFPVMWDGNGARQNQARRERRPHHSDPPRHIVIPVCGD